jgi:hypothetical protein
MDSREGGNACEQAMQAKGMAVMSVAFVKAGAEVYRKV